MYSPSRPPNEVFLLYTGQQQYIAFGKNGNVAEEQIKIVQCPVCSTYVLVTQCHHFCSLLICLRLFFFHCRRVATSRRTSSRGLGLRRLIHITTPASSWQVGPGYTEGNKKERKQEGKRTVESRRREIWHLGAMSAFEALKQRHIMLYCGNIITKV